MSFLIAAVLGLVAVGAAWTAAQGTVAYGSNLLFICLKAAALAVGVTLLIIGGGIWLAGLIE